MTSEEIRSAYEKLFEKDAFELFQIAGLKPADIARALDYDVAVDYMVWLGRLYDARGK